MNQVFADVNVENAKKLY